MLERLKNGERAAGKPKTLIYSAHDLQIVTLLDQLLPDHDYTTVPYASAWTFDLVVDNKCLQGRSSSMTLEDCLRIRASYNGRLVDMLNMKMFNDNNAVAPDFREAN